MPRPIRLATRAVILHEDRLLLVNAWGNNSDLLCCPGGGAEPHASLPDNLKREIHEETGLQVAVGAVCLINEFHAPGRDFHQVDIYFRCTILSGDPFGPWEDPERVVKRWVWTTRDDMATLHFKPDSLPAVAWSDPGAPDYDPLEPLVR